MKKSLLYSVYFLAAFFFFLYALFPSELVGTYISGRLSKIIPDLQVEIADIGPALPFSIKAKDIGINYKKTKLLSPAAVKFSPSPRSFFQKKPSIHYSVAALEGEIAGNLQMSENFAFQNLKAKLVGIQTGKMNGLMAFLKRKFNGVVSGDMMFSDIGSKTASVTANLQIDGGQIEILNPMFGVEYAEVSKVVTKLDILEDRIHIESCNVSGNQAVVDLSGNIFLKRIAGDSAVDISAHIKPHPHFLSTLRQKVPQSLLPAKLFQKSGLPIKFSGTIDKPIFSMK